tara:strand:- start:138 stop:374 length:237 start_codon:yes stop_codon:yes gene_type:complete
MPTSYEKEYTFNVSEYLIDLYPALTLRSVQDICHNAINDPEMDEALQEVIDQWIARQALLDAKYCTEDELDADDEEDE